MATFTASKKPAKSASATLEFDDANLKAIAKAFNNEGDVEFRKKEYYSAIDSYTKGINVKCEDKKLKAKLYSNRAEAQYFLGNYNAALSDAKASREINPSYMKALTAGARACVKLNRFEEAIRWCDEGLAIERENQTLLELKKEAVTKQCEMLETNLEEMNLTETASVEGGSMEFSPLKLDIAKKLGNRWLQGQEYLKRGEYLNELSDFQQAITNFDKYLGICQEHEAHAYGKLGNAYNSVGKYDEAKSNYELQLNIAKNLGDRAVEGQALNSLGNLNMFHLRGDLKKAVEYHQAYLEITKELGDRSGEGSAYGNLGIAFHRLGDFEIAKEYHEKHLCIVKELGDRVGEGKAYGNLGRVHRSKQDFNQAIAYHELHLSIAKKESQKADEACAYYELGCNLESLESEEVLTKALECYRSSARLFYDIRADLRSRQNSTFNDDWRINLFDEYKHVYTALCRVLSKLNLDLEALSAAEEGRGQALADFMQSHYGIEPFRASWLGDQEGTSSDTYRCISNSTVFLGIDTDTINIWLLMPGQRVQFRKSPVHGEAYDATSFLHMLMDNACKRCSIRVPLRSLDVMESNRDDKNSHQSDRSPYYVSKFYQEKADMAVMLNQNPAFRNLYDIVFGPIKDIIQGDELVIVPEGPLCLAPFAAFQDADSKYLCESYRIRVVPSLTTLKLIADSPHGYHSNSDALLVGDPCMNKIVIEGMRFEQLPFARKEVEMIGDIINAVPLTGEKATKSRVLEQLNNCALLHFAVHGSVEAGEIVLAPDPCRSSKVPEKKDFMLTMAEVLNATLQAQLVVLSSCHSGQGEIKAEGVVGIARAFIAAGARSVLVTLSAIDDEATFEFMKSFYQHLVKGSSSSEALNKAMKCLRESDDFSDVKHWAPFVLIGDDVTLNFSHKPTIMAETKIVEDDATVPWLPEDSVFSLARSAEATKARGERNSKGT